MRESRLWMIARLGALAVTFAVLLSGLLGRELTPAWVLTAIAFWIVGEASARWSSSTS